MTGQRDSLLERRERALVRYGISDDAAKPIALDESEAGKRDDAYFYASQWRLMWWRFRRHRMALISVGLLILLYLMAAFAEFNAPYETRTRFRRYQQAPPSTIYWSDENGFRGPFVYAVEQERDPVTRRVTCRRKPRGNLADPVLRRDRALQALGRD